MAVTKNLVEAAKLFQAAVLGDHTARGRVKALVDGTAYVSESVSSSDIARAFAYGVQQTVIEQYAAMPRTWEKIAQRRVLEDFRPEHEMELVFNEDIDLDTNGGEETAPGSLPNIPEATEYPAFYFTEAAGAIQLAKKGARLPFTWEMVINDRWSTIQKIPGQMLRYAANTEDTGVYKLLVNKNGINPITFSDANGNRTKSANKLFDKDYALSVDAVILGKKEVRSRRVNGNLVTVPKFALVVPTSLEDQGRAVLNTTQVVARNAANTREITATTNLGDVELVVSDRLSAINQSADADKTWFLVPAGGSDGTRDSLLSCFLRNHEQPELRVENAGGSYIGGGDVTFPEGSFLNDTNQYRVRHVHSGGLAHGAGLLASKGTAGAAPSQIEA